jgi:hypothetical protein
LPPVLHQRAFIDFLEKLDESILLAILFEAVAGVDISALIVVDLGGIEHEQLFGVVIVQLLDLLRKSHLVYDFVVYHLLIAR